MLTEASVKAAIKNTILTINVRINSTSLFQEIETGVSDIFKYNPDDKCQD